MKKIIDLLHSFSAICMPDAPTQIMPDGTKLWLLNGKLHRENGPAVEHPWGTKCWFQNGLLHRVGGPAVEDSNGTTSWYRSGLLHREDGPAIEGRDGIKMWYVNNRLHRCDGPAVLWPASCQGKKQEYYLNGIAQPDCDNTDDMNAPDPAPSA
jgi:hypothetical protein